MRSPALLFLALPLLLAACEPAPPAAVVPETPVASQAAPLAPAPAAVDVVRDVVVPPAITALLAAPDRSADDRALDAQRRPGETLAFFGVQPGMRVAELGAGGGYTAELLARAVAPGGVVYGENSRFILDRFAQKPWTERLATPAMKNVVRVDREFDDPLPPDAKDLDAVFVVLFYHDTFWLEVDRAKMNAAVFAALKPGGVYAIIDHAGRDGTGSTETKTLHRVEEKVVRDEITRAGFELTREAAFLRNPNDTRDWNDAPSAAGDKRGTSDRFVLAFTKP